MMDSDMLIGTSGWIYQHWNGIFYPAGMAGERKLAFYVERFPTVEINYSFYKLPERGVFEGWREQTPEGFTFAVKASRFLTHMKKLKEPEEPMERLLARATGLGEKLGPILFQMPHWLKLNVERLEKLLKALDKYPGQRFAIEPRHESWLTEEVYRLLESAGVALCIPIHPELPRELRLTADWTFIRFHVGGENGGFTVPELAEWAGTIRNFRRRGARVYAYFNNDWEGYALRDAERLEGMLGLARARAA